MSTSVRRRDRRLVLAACAVAFATAVGSPGPAMAVAEAGTIQQIERYCTTSWRNAGIRRQDWDDCTQQALLELLECMSQADLTTAIEQTDSAARRELNRAVWRLVQRCRRQTREVAYLDAYGASGTNVDSHNDWPEVELAARNCLSERQQRILELTRNGWCVSDIAAELGTTSNRISDEKY